MRRFFISPADRDGDKVTFRGTDFKHIAQSLRMKRGDEVVVSDGAGRDFRVRLIEIAQGRAVGTILSQESRERPMPDVVLFQALAKGSKMDLVVQKATELGASAVVPLKMERSAVKVAEERAARKQARWSQIALEAAKQSQRSYVPVIESPRSWAGAIEMLSGFDLVLVPYEAETEVSLEEALAGVEVKQVAVVIGPEGGFAPREIQDLREGGARIVTLGEQILRTETAAIACLTVVLYHFGRLGGQNLVRREQ